MCLELEFAKFLGQRVKGLIEGRVNREEKSQSLGGSKDFTLGAFHGSSLGEKNCMQQKSDFLAELERKPTVF